MLRPQMMVNEEELPTWSEEGLAARDIFFDEFNSVNFYVEDADQENLYFIVLTKLFPNLTIDQIFPLGGKVPVIRHAQNIDNHSNASRSIYLVDKDFDDLLGHVVEQSNIFYLPKYCIENFFLEHSAVLEIAIETQPKSSREKLHDKLKYDDFISDSIVKLTPLFKLFFVVQRLNLGIKNCDHKPESFSVLNKPEVIDQKKIKSYHAEVKTIVMQTNVFETEKQFENFVASAFPLEIPEDANISGKYLMALTMHYIKKKLSSGNLSLDSLTYRLAKHCSLNELNPLKIKITNYLNNN